MKRDKDTIEMFPALDTSRVRKQTDQEKYDKLIIQKYQTDLFKKEVKK